MVTIYHKKIDIQRLRYYSLKKVICAKKIFFCVLTFLEWIACSSRQCHSRDCNQIACHLLSKLWLVCCRDSGMMMGSSLFFSLLTPFCKHSLSLRTAETTREWDSMSFCNIWKNKTKSLRECQKRRKERNQLFYEVGSRNLQSELISSLSVNLCRNICYIKLMLFSSLGLEMNLQTDTGDWINK